MILHVDVEDFAKLVVTGIFGVLFLNLLRAARWCFRRLQAWVRSRRHADTGPASPLLPPRPVAGARR
jgi:hypothetical protein